MSSTKPKKSTDWNALTRYLGNSEAMHRFFNYSRYQLAPENFCAFYMIEVYKRSPRKRMADFIIENYIKDARAEEGPYGPYAESLNLSSSFRDVDKVKDRMRATYAGIERDFKAKMASQGFIGALMMKASGNSKPPADLFETLQDQVGANLLDTHSRFVTTTGTMDVPDGGTPLTNFKRDITTAGWNPKQLGIW